MEKTPKTVKSLQRDEDRLSALSEPVWLCHRTSNFLKGFLVTKDIKSTFFQKFCHSISSFETFFEKAKTRDSKLASHETFSFLSKYWLRSEFILFCFWMTERDNRTTLRIQFLRKFLFQCGSSY